MKNTILKSILALGIVAFAASMLAISCDKDEGGNNNSTDNPPNVGGGGSGGGNDFLDCAGLCTPLALEIQPATQYKTRYLKIKDNTVYINAGVWASKVTPLSDGTNTNRGFADVVAARISHSEGMFDIKMPSAISSMIFVNRKHVDKDSITLSAFDADCTSSSETADNALAAKAGGGHCREYGSTFSNTSNRIDIKSYLGTVFDNPNTTTHARGTMRCGMSLKNLTQDSSNFDKISDTVRFTVGDSWNVCHIGVINNDLGANVEINDDWVRDSDSVTEMEFYAIGIDVARKTIPEFSSTPGYGLTEFVKEHDNVAFKKLLEKKAGERKWWGELKFKVKFVTSTEFATLPTDFPPRP